MGVNKLQMYTFWIGTTLVTFFVKKKKWNSESEHIDVGCNVQKCLSLKKKKEEQKKEIQQDKTKITFLQIYYQDILSKYKNIKIKIL